MGPERTLQKALDSVDYLSYRAGACCYTAREKSGKDSMSFLGKHNLVLAWKEDCTAGSEDTGASSVTNQTKPKGAFGGGPHDTALLPPQRQRPGRRNMCYV